ncbi:hypothetical protein KP509_35G037900, partial [Ceratopteris richardii]
VLFLGFLFLYVVGIVGANLSRTSNSSTDCSSRSLCLRSLQALMAACQAYVVGATPLPMWGPGASACCTALRGRPLSCLCSQTLPSYVQQLVNVKAVKNVLQTCDLQLPADNTCGGFKLGD